MPLMMRFRRWWAVIFFVVLLLPTAGLFIGDVYDPPHSAEAPQPRWWLRASERLDPFINDFFGFRAAVLYAHNTWGFWLGGAGNKDVAVGKDEALFYRNDEAMEQSFGELLRERRVLKTVDYVAELNAKMKASGGRFVMLVAPNSQTMTPEALSSATRAGPPYFTEYDFLARRMKKRGLPFVDLRPLLRKAAEEGPIYRRNDTHWNARSALIAFNAAMAAVGRPDLAYSAEEVLGEPYERWDGDLVRLLGLPKSDRPDIDFEAISPPSAPAVEIEDLFTDETKKAAYYAFEVEQPGPRIMVLGDSFANFFWRRLLAGRTSAYAFMHHHWCQADEGAIDRFKPDILIYMPVERYLAC